MTPHRFDAIAERLSRQTLLAELGREGMERIADARFLVVGAGGLGSPALIYLAASGGCRITVADPDTVSVTNLSRQLLHEEEALGVNKAKNAARVLPRYNPAVEVTPIDTYLDEKTLADVLDTVDIVLDCSDNLATRQSVNRAALKARKPLVFGSAVRFSGQISVFDFRSDASPCYRCLFDEDDAANDQKASTLGIFSPLTGLVGTLQAAEALRLAAGLPSPWVGKLLMIDMLAGEFETVRCRRRRSCPVCGGH